ncbi:5-formyltetrahydrofolate cyclo-ligase [Deinococcus piscis]|uniref:5-formyltetrahydrofolate cyclo-ligase n=1 Tax=Deinococcus piscis TaxID=394230 RepID=A0ABQ3KA82_9DEIO|nr:5-formyltetrahydrofolate cyclo-ligase [Deinococcus piscis]GHG02064.1 5-formyltetrahydrofolate cyclo-ligase [Deinococcus piscis]
MTLSPPPLHASKPEWRQWARHQRAAQPDVSAAVAEHTAALLRQLGARRVLAYHALPGEPDLSTLQHSFQLLTTRARVRPERRLTVHEWVTATEVSPLGVRQPPRDTPQIPVSEIDAAVLPALSFDRRGFRLGYGGGFYDRFLAGLTRPTIGVTHSALLLDQLPHEAHDVPLHWIVTEQGAVRVR